MNLVHIAVHHPAAAEAACQALARYSLTPSGASASGIYVRCDYPRVVATAVQDIPGVLNVTCGPGWPTPLVEPYPRSTLVEA